MINENWLERQKRYQEETYGIDYRQLWESGEIVNYVSTMLTAAQIEVAEAYQEVPWKPWANLTTEQRMARLMDNAGKVTGELVDVMFFIANVLVALGVSDAALEAAYLAKMGVNKRRQDTGYDGISTKCAKCGRALDEPNAAPPVQRSGSLYCGFICAVEDQDEAPEVETVR